MLFQVSCTLGVPCSVQLEGSFVATTRALAVAGTCGDSAAPLAWTAQLSAPSTYIDAACFRNEQEAVVVYPLDLSVFLNSLMFSCGATPRLAKTILELVNFDGFSIRRRKSTTTCSAKPSIHRRAETTTTSLRGTLASGTTFATPATPR